MAASKNKICKVILFANQKGGSGKSSNIINISTASLFSGNNNVVILDCDPQQSTYLWQEERDPRLSSYDYVLPQVTCNPSDMLPSDVISALKNALIEENDYAEIWIDTAGFVGFKNETAQQYIEDILPCTDLIVTPLKATKLDTRSTAQCMSHIDDLLKNLGKTDIPRLLLRSDIKGGAKGLEYMDTLVGPLLEQHPDWSCMDTHIPSSTIFVKAVENGGNAFIPRKIDRISDASVAAYAEIQVALGIKSTATARREIKDVISKLASVRNKAKNEKISDESHDE